MPLLYLTSANEALEVVVASGLVTLALGVFVAIPFVIQYFVDERRQPRD